MANLGYSIPVYEIADGGEWVSNIPATTTTTPPPTTTITEVIFNEGTTQDDLIREPQAPLPVPASKPKNVGSAPDGDYDLFDAEWDDYPFEATVRLLEDRYPPGTPDKNHFRLSVAVEFLREGGMVRGLDNLWHSNE